MKVSTCVLQKNAKILQHGNSIHGECAGGARSVRGKPQRIALRREEGKPR